jgi:hypothetical protein
VDSICEAESKRGFVTVPKGAMYAFVMKDGPLPTELAWHVPPNSDNFRRYLRAFIFESIFGRDASL